ncbi:MAG: DUF4494 domain-containing protein [Symploca sp. SIO1A3]|nr:DUF4494 domain-containing protein [Symploca sp. SIO2C1]NER49674.1 DUF4494 domain-containing protein [Symploca sp. SIO1A3]
MATDVKEDKLKFQGSASQLNVTQEALPAVLVELQAASLAEAIKNAQEALSSTLISWVLADVSGQFGGFTQVCEVTTVIYAKSGPS